MEILQDGEKTIFAGLTEKQWTAATDWLYEQPINRETWEHDHSKIVVHGATQEQIQELTDVLA